VLVNNFRGRELALVLVGFAALTITLTYPLAFHLGTLLYEFNTNLDGQFSVWNIAWVARTLVIDPLHVFDANIFHPHRWTLAYSETNLGAGALAVPVFWATRNPYAAHNFVLLLSFVLSATGMYYLVRYLTNDRRAAVVAAIVFAYCPYVFAHLPHIQLLMTAGLPFSLLAFHRLADRPSAGRGVALGAIMAAQAFFCAYYAVFVMLMVGYAVMFVAVSRRLWREGRYWIAVAVAAGVAIATVLPILAIYVMLRRATGFSRSVEAAGSFSADWHAYFASSAYAHAWILNLLHTWRDVLFPGFVALVFGIGGVVVGWFRGGRARELAALYGSLAVLACWESFGPSAGLYRLTYAMVPGFGFMRAASRFGLVFSFALAVLGAQAIAHLLMRTSKPTWVAAFLAMVAAAELAVPLRLMRVPPPEPAYQHLATLPYGAVIEMPVYSARFAFVRERYMLSSTIHWMPLVDAYSDYIPQDFIDRAEILGEFPTRDAFKELEHDHVRYAVFHVDNYGSQGDALRVRLTEFAPYLRRLYADDRTWLYEIVGFPP
jgi:hypothetical protein